MLISKDRLDPGAPAAEFIDPALTARAIQVLPITPAVAELAVSFDNRVGSDPADRLIAATAVHHRAVLITSDKDLKKNPPARQGSGISLGWGSDLATR